MLALGFEAEGSSSWGLSPGPDPERDARPGPHLLLHGVGRAEVRPPRRSLPAPRGPRGLHQRGPGGDSLRSVPPAARRPRNFEGAGPRAGRGFRGPGAGPGAGPGGKWAGRAGGGARSGQEGRAWGPGLGGERLGGGEGAGRWAGTEDRTREQGGAGARGSSPHGGGQSGFPDPRREGN